MFFRYPAITVAVAFLLLAVQRQHAVKAVHPRVHLAAACQQGGELRGQPVAGRVNARKLDAVQAQGLHLRLASGRVERDLCPLRGARLWIAAADFAEGPTSPDSDLRRNAVCVA